MYIQVCTGLEGGAICIVAENNVIDVVVSQNSVVSLHVQIHNQLRQLILSGHWPNGTRIPSESEFANHLRLSRSTVRLALQQAEVEGLIERIAGRGTFVSYVPTKANEHRLIAFVTNDFDSENQLLALSGTESEAKARGYQVVFSKARNRQEELDLLNDFQEKDAGVILWSNAADIQPQTDGIYQQFRIPIVLLDRKINGFDCDSVVSDNYGGTRAMMRHLVALGHRDIAVLSHHATDLSSVNDRLRAYHDVMQEAGLTPLAPCLIGQPGKEMGLRHVLRSSVDSRSPELQHIKDYMLNAQPRPTAIYAVNDLLAVLAMRAMKLLDWDVPGAMSIAGFDDSELAPNLDVPLTTVAQDPFTIGKCAAQLLIDRIEGHAGPVNNQVIPTQLRVRSSTSPPQSPSLRSGEGEAQP
jgi:DNA-binding LacI/PurR family transcriptional regulator